MNKILNDEIGLRMGIGVYIHYSHYITLRHAQMATSELQSVKL